MRFKCSEFYDLLGNFYANTKPVLTDRARTQELKRLDTHLSPMSKQSQKQSFEE